MSAYIAAKYEDCIQIVTDAAAYDKSGKMQRVLDKCWYSTHLPVAITGRGNSYLVESIAASAVKFADECENVEQLMGWLGGAAKRLAEKHPEIEEKGFLIELLVASYSEAEGFGQRVLHNIPENGSELYHWHKMEGWCIGAPDIDPAHVRAMEAQMSPADPRFLPTFGARLLEGMRFDCAPSGRVKNGVDFFGSVVGGNCRLTTVSRTGVQSRILKTWNDQIGEVVNPFDHPNVQPIGNRKERRRTAKEQTRTRRPVCA